MKKEIIKLKPALWICDNCGIQFPRDQESIIERHKLECQNKKDDKVKINKGKGGIKNDI